MLTSPLAAQSLVLVVEDDAGTRELYRSVLRGHGFAVVAVADGTEALRFLEVHTPAAVVLDLGLPRLHGADVYREMDAQGLLRNVGVVIVTGEPSDDFERVHPACVLHKPVEPHELAATVEACIRAVRT